MRFWSGQDIGGGQSASPITGWKVASSRGRGAAALWYVGPGRGEIREEPAREPEPHEVRVRALHGALSRGTERLVFAGRVPEAEFERMRAPFMGGAFPFPVKYGYAVVGRIEAGPSELRDRVVFALHPHQSVFTIPAEAAIPVPAGVPPPRAVLGANMETALNAAWDGAPGPADRIAVVGAGVVGSPLPSSRGEAAGRRVRAAGGGAGRLRSGVSCERHRRRACDRASSRGRGGERDRAQLVRNRRGADAARRGLPPP